VIITVVSHIKSIAACCREVADERIICINHFGCLVVHNKLAICIYIIPRVLYSSAKLLKFTTFVCTLQKCIVDLVF
ncbi:hypothetical protein ACJX0J_033199, partial [Zea mays]